MKWDVELRFITQIKQISLLSIQNWFKKNNVDRKMKGESQREEF